MRLGKYGHLTLPVVFLDIVIPDIDFVEEALVQCNCKNTFVDNGDLQIITIKF